MAKRTQKKKTGSDSKRKSAKPKKAAAKTKKAVTKRKKTAARPKKTTTTRKKTTAKTRRAAASVKETPAKTAPVQQEAPPVEPQPFIDRGPDLPPGFGDDRIMALVRDPNWLFLYWELQGEKSNSLVAQRGGGKAFLELPWALRLNSADPSFNRDIPISVAAGNYYLEITPVSDLVIEIGFYDSEGEYVPVARTTGISAPDTSPSPDYGEHWMHRPVNVRPGRRAFEMKQAPEPVGLAPRPSVGPVDSVSSADLVRRPRGKSKK